MFVICRVQCALIYPPFLQSYPGCCSPTISVTVRLFWIFMWYEKPFFNTSRLPSQVDHSWPDHWRNKQERRGKQAENAEGEEKGPERMCLKQSVNPDIASLRFSSGWLTWKFHFLSQKINWKELLNRKWKFYICKLPENCTIKKNLTQSRWENAKKYHWMGSWKRRQP